MNETALESHKLPLDDLHKGYAKDFSAEVVMETRDMSDFRFHEMMRAHEMGLALPEDNRNRTILTGSRNQEIRIYSIRPTSSTAPAMQREIALLNRYIQGDTGHATSSQISLEHPESSLNLGSDQDQGALTQPSSRRAFKDFQPVHGAEASTWYSDDPDRNQMKILLEDSGRTHNFNYQSKKVRTLISTPDDVHCDGHSRVWESDFQDRIDDTITRAAVDALYAVQAKDDHTRSQSAYYGTLQQPDVWTTHQEFDANLIDRRFGDKHTMKVDVSTQYLRPSLPRHRDDQILNIRMPGEGNFDGFEHGSKRVLREHGSVDFMNPSLPTTEQTVTLRWSRVLDPLDDPLEYPKYYSDYTRANSRLAQQFDGIGRVEEVDAE
ncbi:uncharacterized protein I303_105584 [Kwoniella dejecticola CBS 10117]|uniref:Uncharacterized protein n=1 Tax=Kwoniella dejecticola CBS 10117 TaxID=1296121 RepID=A0A1A6A228_9TREE|nr:uncharacterized protein I303_04973 [Kwoniella dejecticola CBS 10117]OBR84116.1 hypothetical protein I303_04973 [Kwoniella dejecticola CBS 10117]